MFLRVSTPPLSCDFQETEGGRAAEGGGEPPDRDAEADDRAEAGLQGGVSLRDIRQPGARQVTRQQGNS